MRQLLLLALLALVGSAHAQTLAKADANNAKVAPPVEAYSCSETVSGFQHKADSLLQYLDKSQIPTRILYDRVSRAAGLVGFNTTAPRPASFPARLRPICWNTMGPTRCT